MLNEGIQRYVAVGGRAGRRALGDIERERCGRQVSMSAPLALCRGLRIRIRPVSYAAISNARTRSPWSTTTGGAPFCGLSTVAMTSSLFRGGQTIRPYGMPQPHKEHQALKRRRGRADTMAGHDMGRQRVTPNESWRRF